MALLNGLNTLKIQTSEVSGRSKGPDRGSEAQKGRGTFYQRTQESFLWQASTMPLNQSEKITSHVKGNKIIVT